MSIAILGAGAFGTALAVSLAQNGAVTLWARDPAQVRTIQQTGRNEARLPGVALPENVSVTAEIATACAADVILLAMPMQQMASFLGTHSALLVGKTLVACSKGIDLATGQGPVALISEACPDARAAILTGPSFAADIARGLPTALTLACRDDAHELQARLSTPNLRLYRTTDTVGAELGGALKNVIAIAAGVVIGAGLGDSARAALMTRGFAEMNRLAIALGAHPDTLAGLSGLGAWGGEALRYRNDRRRCRDIEGGFGACGKAWPRNADCADGCRPRRSSHNHFRGRSGPSFTPPQTGVIMLFAIICQDKPDHLQTRLDTRAAHLDYIAQTGNVMMAGPFLEDGAMCGSLVIITADDLAAAQGWAKNDPYAKAGLFESVSVTEWKKVVG